MEWTQVFVILGVFIGGFLYLASKIDGVNKDLSNQIQKNREAIQKNREEILWIKFRLDPNEHPKWKEEDLEEDLKEN